MRKTCPALTATVFTTVNNPDTLSAGSQHGVLDEPAKAEPIAQPLVYRVDEIAQMLNISRRAAYNLCNHTTDFRVIRIGGSIRVSKASFDAWFGRIAR